MRRMLEDMETVRKGLGPYEDWKDEGGQGMRDSGELLEQGKRLVERGRALLAEAGVCRELIEGLDMTEKASEKQDEGVDEGPPGEEMVLLDAEGSELVPSHGAAGMRRRRPAGENGV